MPQVLSLDEVLAGGETMVEVTTPDRATAERVWAFVFAVALTDRATSVHFHPWLGDGRLWYIVNGGQRYVVNPPPPELSGHLLVAARSLVGRGRLGGWFGRGAVAGEFAVAWRGEKTRWAGAVWSAGTTAGAELYLLRESHARYQEAAEPGAAPDPRRQSGFGG